MRIAVLSDIHANLVALDAVISTFDRLDAVWHLGDVVGYGPDPNGVIKRLRELGATGVRGNHDAAAIGRIDIDWFNPAARAAIVWTREVIDDASRSWLSDLPVTETDTDFTLVHGSPRDPTWEYIASVEAARENLAELGTRFGLHGHTHRPIAFTQDGDRLTVVPMSDGGTRELGTQRALINPGSVGQPRDGSPAASYLVLDTATATCTWQRVPYDIAAVQGAMREHGLPRFLVERLSVGA